MDEDLSRRIRDLSANPTSDTQRSLRRALTLQAGGSVGVREAKLELYTAIKRSLKGTPQVIGKASNAVVLISVADLATLLIAEDNPTPAGALEGVGLGARRQ